MTNHLREANLHAHPHWGIALAHIHITFDGIWHWLVIVVPFINDHQLGLQLKTSHFLHGQCTHQTCHPLSTVLMLWIDSVSHSSSSYLQICTAIEEECTNISQATINNLTNQWTVYEGFGLQMFPPYSNTAHFNEAIYCGQPKEHMWNNLAV